MRNRKLGYVLFALAAAGCTVNGKPMFGLGSLAGAGAGGGGGASGSSSGDGGSGGSGGSGDNHASDGSGGLAVAHAGPAPAFYAWCKDVREDQGANRVEAALDPEELTRAVPAILQALCFPDDDARKQRAAIEAARQTWMRRLVVNERDWATDIVAWGNLRYADRMAALRDSVGPTPGTAWTGMAPIEQWALLRMSIAASSAFAARPGAFYYIADALALTEAGRLGLIERCLSDGDEPDPVGWALCQPEIDALDPGKLGAEIRGEAGRSAPERMTIRLAAEKLLRRLPAHAANVKQLVAKDPAYAKLFELAKTARTEWSERAASRADLVAAVLAMDDARVTRSRKATEGCAARIWPLFADAVGKLPPKRFENLRPEPGTTFLATAVGAVLQDADAYLAANALVACEGAADHLLKQLRSGLTNWPGFRGPRTAALTAIHLANLTPDRRGEKIDVPRVALDLAIGSDEPTDGARQAGSGSGAGVIASVVGQGDTVRVTFQATSEVQDHCVSRRTTHRISRIDSSGNFIYESVCTQWKAERVDTTSRPVTIVKRYAGGLQPKRYASIVGGVPEAVWAKASSPTPLAAFGVLLK